MRGKHSTVVLFIHGLPGEVSNRELKSFVRTKLGAEGLKTKTLFSELVGDCNILRITDPQSSTVEFHGLIEIRPAEAAMRAIDILNGTTYKSSALAIHRYQQRSPLRQHQGPARDTQGSVQAMPQVKERRPALKIDLMEPHTRNPFTFRGFRTNPGLANR